MGDIAKILDLLFSPEDEVSVGIGPYATHSITQEAVLSGEVSLLSPNAKIPLQRALTANLTHLCINACKGFRSDSTVTKFRTFLLEIDIGDLKSQFEYIKKLGIPYSCMIFSGSKSLHTAIVLEEPIENENEYRKIYQWILNVGTLFDQNCKNPSRCIRMPGTIRPETGKEQKLVRLKNRVSTEELMKWLENYENQRPKERVKKELTGKGDFDNLSLWARKQLKDGLDYSKGRNKAWFALACDFFKNGYDENETIEILESYFTEENDFKHKEFLAAIESARKHMVN